MRLAQAQFKEILPDKMTEANGVPRLLALMVEIIMEGERELYKEVGSISKEAFFVVMNLDREGRRDIVGVYNNFTEGSGILGGVLRGLKAQGARESWPDYI